MYVEDSAEVLDRCRCIPFDNPQIARARSRGCWSSWPVLIPHRHNTSYIITFFSFVPAMQPAKDAPDLAAFDSSIPVGPDLSGEIFYMHFEPLSPLSIAIITAASIAIALFLAFYFYPIVCKRFPREAGGANDLRTSAHRRSRSLFAWPARARTSADLPTSQLLVRRGRPNLALAPVRASFLFAAGKLLPTPSTSASASSTDSSSSGYGEKGPATPARAAVAVVVAPAEVQSQEATNRSPSKHAQGGGTAGEGEKGEAN
ncbi:hypothetical protein BV25DRAFT_293615 [Artomyces pyxidatus]|uniref:Uncharacterized protein n=1 Tax=Artomyces pyxidatus TaxID=48021 RepID=A0ACB8T712_9AGAM|nr:hypothetical protein BV25DRAFT_293615 [Artomyces pyxidatus]